MGDQSALQEDATELYAKSVNIAFQEEKSQLSPIKLKYIKNKYKINLNKTQRQRIEKMLGFQFK